MTPFIIMLRSKFSSFFPLVVKLRQGLRFVLNKQSILNQTNYLNSYVKRIPQNAKGDILPWLNYSVIDFLESRLTKHMSVFEYGAGYSTLFFAKRVKEIVSIEYNSEWVKTVRELTSNLHNSTVEYRSLDSNYVESIVEHEKLFDLILVDGRERVKCARLAINKLSDSGVLILDDSKRERYAEIWNFFTENGFKEITFSGLKPMGLTYTSTTIFYRANNCFNI